MAHRRAAACCRAASSPTGAALRPGRSRPARPNLVSASCGTLPRRPQTQRSPMRQRRQDQPLPGGDRSFAGLVGSQRPKQRSASRPRRCRPIALARQRRGIRQAKPDRVRQARHAGHAARGIEWPIRPDLLQSGTDGEKIRRAREMAQEVEKIRLRPARGISAGQTNWQIGPQRDRTAIGFPDQAYEQGRNLAHQAGRAQASSYGGAASKGDPALSGIGAPIGMGGEAGVLRWRSP